METSLKHSILAATTTAWEEANYSEWRELQTVFFSHCVRRGHAEFLNNTILEQLESAEGRWSIQDHIADIALEELKKLPTDPDVIEALQTIFNLAADQYPGYSSAQHKLDFVNNYVLA